MCGRFILNIKPEELIAQYSLTENGKESSFYPRFNIAPSQKILAITNPNGTNTSSYFSWGIFPRWNSKTARYRPIINARAETVPNKITFSAAFQSRRCLIPATGYFEWSRMGENKKQPNLIYVEGRKCFAMAGLWEPARKPDSHASCVIITRNAQNDISQIHSRMPLIINRENYKDWLTSKAPSELLPLILDSPAQITLKSHRVSDLVNSPKNDSLECIQPF